MKDIVHWNLFVKECKLSNKNLMFLSFSDIAEEETLEAQASMGECIEDLGVHPLPDASPYNK